MFKIRYTTLRVASAIVYYVSVIMEIEAVVYCINFKCRVEFDIFLNILNTKKAIFSECHPFLETYYLSQIKKIDFFTFIS